MDPLVRRRALGVAAKVALALSIPACSSASSEDEAPSGSQDLISAPPHEATGCDGSTPTPPASCESLITETVSDGAAACCRDFFANNTEHQDDFWPGPTLTASASRPVAKACCGALGAFAAQHPGDEAAGAASYHLWWGTCCQFDSSPMACTPWGPPMPPAMPRGFDLSMLAEVA